jgi:hypothetical protein
MLSSFMHPSPPLGGISSISKGRFSRRDGDTADIDSVKLWCVNVALNLDAESTCPSVTTIDAVEIEMTSVDTIAPPGDADAGELYGVFSAVRGGVGYTPEPAVPEVCASATLREGLTST